MSYVLQIWENPVDKPLPASIAEAVQHMEQLYGHELAVPSPKFMELAERLLQHYPDPNTAMPYEDEIDFNDLAWPEVVDGKGLNAVWVLGLNTGGLFDEARPLVIKEANGLGLCVMDEQAGEVYLPSSKVLIMPDQATNGAEILPLPNAPSTITILNKVFEIKTFSLPSSGKVIQESPKNKEVLPLAFEYLIPLMKEHGYEVNKGKRRFLLNFTDGWCEVNLIAPTDKSPSYAPLSIPIYLRCHAITDLVYTLTNTSPYATLSVDHLKWMKNFDDIEIFNDSYCIKRYDQIEKVLAELHMKFEMIVLPALTDCQTLADFERHLNPPEDNPTSIFEFHPRGRQYEKIIAAYLVGNPILESLCEKFTKLAGTQECINYVRTHPR